MSGNKGTHEAAVPEASPLSESAEPRPAEGARASEFPPPAQVTPSDRPLVSGLRPPPLGARAASPSSGRRSPWRPEEGVPASAPLPSSRPSPRRPFDGQPVERHDPPLPLTAGALLDGRYRILDVLGGGGMGALLLARNEALDVEVAIKLLRPGLAPEWSEAMSRQLVQEARVAARLGHPAIVRVLDFGVTVEGTPFLVMERLEGTDLGSELATRGTVPPIKAVRCLLPVAHGLAAAHAKGVIHRDVKPENIFLARTDAGRVQPKLVDFGVAKLESQSGAERITAPGGLVGSPGYMAPEQALGGDVGAAADVWSLCVVLYEMVTGRLPFEARNCTVLMRAIVDRDPVPIAGHLPGEAALSAIVERGMAKDPADRWPTVQALGEALAAWLIQRGVTEDVCGQALDTTWLAPPTSKNGFDAFASVPPPSPARLRACRLDDSFVGELTAPPAEVPSEGSAPQPRLAVRPPPPSGTAPACDASLPAAPPIPQRSPSSAEGPEPPSAVPSSSPYASAEPDVPTVRPGQIRLVDADSDPAAPSLVGPAEDEVPHATALSPSPASVGESALSRQGRDRVMPRSAVPVAVAVAAAAALAVAAWVIAWLW